MQTRFDSISPMHWSLELTSHNMMIIGHVYCVIMGHLLHGNRVSSYRGGHQSPTVDNRSFFSIIHKTSSGC